ncbi:MAG: DUF1956 domain-containing protein, partial [Desulfobacteraceae bacterium]|nr:DUF1956 domain-containing protein [Desulfobacteraceae bacterium]
SALRRYPPDIGLRNEAGPEESLRAFVRSLLLRVFDSGRPAWHWCLMAREMADPTSALDELVNEAIRPVHERLRGIVRALVGEGATEEQVRYCMACILGQCLYFHHAKAVLKRLNWPEPGLEEVEPLTKHITEFSLSALRAMRDKTTLQELPAEGDRAAGNGKG